MYTSDGYIEQLSLTCELLAESVDKELVQRWHLRLLFANGHAAESLSYANDGSEV